jgi:uncharacterized protein
MSTGIQGLRELLVSMHPHLHSGVYVFCAVPGGNAPIPDAAIAAFREPERLSIIIEEGVARKLGLTVQFRAAWITLTVESSLEAVGLTAAVAQALTAAGISCNVVAATFHDHLFVPVKRGAEAMAILETLSAQATAPIDP